MVVREHTIFVLLAIIKKHRNGNLPWSSCSRLGKGKLPPNILVLLS
jgi:hypothetical protein